MTDQYYLMYLKHFLAHTTFVYIAKPPVGFGVWLDVVDF